MEKTAYEIRLSLVGSEMCIRDRVERCARKANARYEGRTEEVLAEGINPKDPSQLMGRTRTNRLTFFSSTGADGRAYEAGDLVPVRIDAVRSFSLSGSPLPH